jgi:hypothetical protein
MYKRGDQVVIISQTSSWNDTAHAFERGILQLGETYTVVEYNHNYPPFGRSVQLKTRHAFHRSWWVGAEAVKLVGGKIKRNLPDWF